MSPKTEPISVLLVDVHDVVRRGISRLIDSEPDLFVVAEADNGETALELVAEKQPDVVLVDMTMLHLNGPEVTRAILNCCTKTHVIAFTIHEGEDTFFDMLDAGARGYIPKSASAEELMLAIRAVARNEVYLHSSVAGLLLKEHGASPNDNAAQDDDLSTLTDREQQVLAHLADGLMNREIGEKLAISPKTVARHRENIMRKLDLHNRTDLVRFAIRVGLVDVENS